VARRQSSSRRRSSSARSGSDRSGSDRSGSGRASSRSAGGRAPRARSDGKVDISCPQCAAQYRVSQDMLDEKIECTECHRVFFAKTTAGKRVAPPDYTKAYVGFGVLAVAIILIFVLSSNGGGNANANANNNRVVEPEKPTFSVGTHPRAHQLLAWAQSIGNGNQLTLGNHTDFAALGGNLGVGGDKLAVLKELQEGEAGKYLRELEATSAALDSEAHMESDSGSAVISVTPRAGDTRYNVNRRGELAVTFKMEGDNVKVTGLSVKMKPVLAKGQVPDGVKRYELNEDIAKSKAVEITDGSGTRTVQESEPTPVPHWSGSSPEMQAKVDQAIADIIASASEEARSGLFANAVGQFTFDMEKIQAVVPRALNAMYEHYGDVNANNQVLSQLNHALKSWTGYAVNYSVKDSGDAARDKKERESCVRQWFAFWRRYHKDLSEFVTFEEESLDDDGGK